MIRSPDKNLYQNRNKDQKDWDEESLSSQSEVTLQKFDSEVIEKDQFDDLNEVLDKYPLEERVNFLIDRTVGRIIDSRNGKVIQTIYPSLVHHQSDPIIAHMSRDLNQYASPYSIPIFADTLKPERKRPKTNSAHQNDKARTQTSQQSIWDDYWQQAEKIHKKLLMGICRKDKEILNDLFNKKNNHIPLNVNYKSFDNWTPIHFAALHGNIFALDYLLQHPEIYVNSLTNFKWSALHIAVKNNKCQVIRKLLDHGIEPNYQDDDGNTALHYAVELGYKQSVICLLQGSQKLDKTMRNNQGMMPQDLTLDQEILQILGVDTTNLGGGWSRGNRHRQRLIEKVQAQKHKKNFDFQKNHRNQPNAQKQPGSEEKKILSKKENIVRMYQLLQQNRQAEKIGINSFKFYKKIGEGAFGEVYIVKKNKSQKLYALKAIKKQKIFGTNLIKYIKTEKEVLSLINHPFIVHLHYAFQTESHLFLVMDYCGGGDLGKFLQKQRRFDEKTVKKYAAEILLGLEALHKEKIIYRDLKPDNIVLDTEGHALITDFGLSKKTTSIDDINKSFCGTPAYLPLEIINKKGHNRMADWYEYGVVLYELLAGIPPFYAETRQQLYQNVRAGIVRFPKGSSQSFRDLIKKLLSQNPEKRLGFQNDAQSIKEHKWFQDIDWGDVFHRRLEMPKISNKVVLNEPIKTKFIEERTQKYLINGWSFIADE